jgi:hypothetical protein
MNFKRAVILIALALVSCGGGRQVLIDPERVAGYDDPSWNVTSRPANVEATVEEGQ